MHGYLPGMASRRQCSWYNLLMWARLFLMQKYIMSWCSRTYNQCYLNWLYISLEQLEYIAVYHVYRENYNHIHIIKHANTFTKFHDDALTWTHFLIFGPLWETTRYWCRALMFSFLLAWISFWTKRQGTGEMRCLNADMTSRQCCWNYNTICGILTN